MSPMRVACPHRCPHGAPRSMPSSLTVTRRTSLAEKNLHLARFSRGPFASQRQKADDTCEHDRIGSCDRPYRRPDDGGTSREINVRDEIDERIRVALPVTPEAKCSRHFRIALGLVGHSLTFEHEDGEPESTEVEQQIVQSFSRNTWQEGGVKPRKLAPQPNQVISIGHMPIFSWTHSRRRREDAFVASVLSAEPIEYTRADRSDRQTAMSPSSAARLG